jgi:starch synthase
MRIIHIATEFAPIAKAGGLGEVLVGLCRELTSQHEQVEVIIPKYGFIPESLLNNLKKEVPEFPCVEKNIPHLNTMWSADVENCHLHLLETNHPEGYFQRSRIYGYQDDTARFIYFSKAVCEYLKLKKEPIDVLHLHEWHTALCAPLVKEIMTEQLNIRSILLTIHNLEYQGKCAVWDLDAIGLKGIDFLKPTRLQDNACPQTINLLKGGIVYADAVNTVSTTYSQEILTSALGCNLDSTLRLHKNKLSGIVNGIDQKLWDPAIDTYLTANFAPDTSLSHIQSSKKRNKETIAQKFNLKTNETLWLGAVTRLVPQKGLELLEEALHYTLSQGGIFILCGASPIPSIQDHFEKLQEQYKDQQNCVIQLEYDDGLAHLIYAALDFTLVPSHFEPCGLTQLIAMRYGTIPIVRSTGGLKDTVFDADDYTIPASLRNGFTFSNPKSLRATLQRAFALPKQDPATFQSLIRRAIQSDFSWKKPAEAYLQLYRKITEKNNNKQNTYAFPNAFLINNRLA